MNQLHSEEPKCFSISVQVFYLNHETNILMEKCIQEEKAYKARGAFVSRDLPVNTEDQDI